MSIYICSCVVVYCCVCVQVSVYSCYYYLVLHVHLSTHTPGVYHKDRKVTEGSPEFWSSHAPVSLVYMGF